jgi:anthranilate synthase component 2
MILVIDNYDSFTWNLVHYLMEMGAEVEVVRNDALTAAQAIATGAQGFLLSPGPCTPNEAGVSLDLVGAAADAKLPLLGVCLGHQSIGQYFGGKVVRGGLMHGKTSPVTHDGTGVFEGLVVNARSDDTHVMGFRHATLPIHGVQFHPESIATEHGHAMVANFLRLCGVKTNPLPA